MSIYRAVMLVALLSLTTLPQCEAEDAGCHVEYQPDDSNIGGSISLSCVDPSIAKIDARHYSLKLPLNIIHGGDTPAETYISMDISASLPRGYKPIRVAGSSDTAGLVSKSLPADVASGTKEVELTSPTFAWDGAQEHALVLTITVACDVDGCKDHLPPDSAIRLAVHGPSGEYVGATLTKFSFIEARSDTRGKSQLASDALVSKSGLLLQRAIVLKTLADEKFLRSNHDEANKIQSLYSSAQEAAKIAAADPAVSDDVASQLKLLQADIDYRLVLLSGGLDFWGGYRSRTPDIPIRHLVALEDIYREFESVMAQTDALVDKQEADDSEILKAEASLHELTGKLNAYSIDQEKAIIVDRKVQRSIGDMRQTVSTISAQQERVKQRMDALAAQQDALTSKASALLVSAVASSAGVDPSLVDGIRKGDVRSIASAYVTSQLGDPNSPISSAVSSIGQEAEKFSNVYRQAKRDLATAQELQSNLKASAELLKHPTADGVLQLGSSIYDQLPEADRAAVRATLDKRIPVVQWIRSAQRVATDTTEALQKVQRTAANLMIEANIAQSDINRTITGAFGQLRMMREEADSKTLQMTQDVIGNLTGDGADAQQWRDAVNASVEALPAGFLRCLSTQEREVVLAAVNAPSEREFAEIVSRSTQPLLRKVQFSADGVSVEMGERGTRVTLSRRVLSLDKLLDANSDRAVVEAQKLVEELGKRSREAAAATLGALPVDVLLSRIADEKSKISGTRTKQALTDALGADFANAALDSSVKTMLGYAFAADAVYPAKSPESTSIPSGTEEPLIPAGGEPDPNAQAAAMLALNYAFPGAGVALQMAQSFAAMDANRELNEQLAAESAMLMAKKIELVEHQVAADYDEVLAQKDTLRAEALAEAAHQQISDYQEMMQNSVASRDTARLKLGLRRGWTFYLTERMREEFDAFDRSFALWSTGSAGRGIVEQEIRRDPQNVRYALDSDIQLFGWLSRSDESSHTDPDTLRVHWGRMLRLVKDLCEKRGCKPGDGTLGQIASSRAISVPNELLSSEDRARFKKWKANESGIFRARFSLLPFQGILPSSLQNVRLIDVRMSGISSAGEVHPVDGVRLTHEGVSYIPRLAGGESEMLSMELAQEVMIPRSTISLEQAGEFDLNALRTRYDGYFNGTNLPSPRIFEGYGVYAQYELELEPNVENGKLSDLILRFAYHYTDGDNVASEAQFYAKILGGDSLGDRLSSSVALGERRSAGCTRDEYAGPTLRVNLQNPELLRFFIPRKQTEIEALSKDQRMDFDQLSSCSQISLQAVCVANSVAAARIDAYVRSPGAADEAVVQGLIKPGDGIEELKSVLVNEVVAARAKGRCKPSI